MAVRRPLFRPISLNLPSLPARRAGPSTATLSGLPGRAARFGRLVRQRYLLAFDLVGVVAAAYLALAFRYDRISEPLRVPGFLPVVAILLVMRTLTNVRLGLYRRRWRFASVPDLERIVIAVALGSLGSIVAFYLISVIAQPSWTVGFPRSFWAIELLLSVILVGGVRFGIRAASEMMTGGSRRTAGDPQATLLYGAGRAGVLMARSAQQNPGAGVRPVGFLDDDMSLKGGIVAGLRVLGGLGDLERAVATTRARRVLITMPGAMGVAVRRVVDAALALKLEVRTVPSVTDLLDGSVDAYRIRRVRVEDLLRRPIVTERALGVHEIIRDRDILITGAGGSIGSELARQVFALHPRRLVLVDRAESSLYLIQRELETRRGRGQGDGELHIRLANVSSRAAMHRLVARESPSVIFHVQARADDGRASLRCRPREHRRDARDARCSGRRGRRPIRLRLDGQGRPTLQCHGRKQAGR
ncbi:MAG: NAD-dependent epimerase/dehydratase family protein [Chloroflexi bacterium]|nr:MAG: NAD-dependent epimerase/dehydratase family protein [Chloroflexota bacterium]